ncbi:Na(+)/H(+) antiporter subunit F1 [Virgibacillus necropolis]|uniref:Na(+)/H(+) antiporter subunit F n=1 Tax=Virgibacillus necropolis TaxID=163877 RepID=A0A221MBV6_9BACI|nr:Na(+)/H(+) antiporter subunit F1 [Virgibacillus necropolis]ASN05156.1 Na(+)/H(+) antiporter subunit F [Virgibacillus necropolis]
MNELLNLSEHILKFSTILSVIGIAISLVLLLYRMLIGPSNADRAVALDTIGMGLMGLAALLSIILSSTNFNDVILLIGILLFIGTLAIAKFLEKGVIIDRNLD